MNLTIEYELIKAAVRQAAAVAAAIQSDVSITEQRIRDFVTEGDLEAERILMGAKISGVPFLTEEASGKDFHLVDAGGKPITKAMSLEELRESYRVRVMDPIDGTVNYGHGDPYWAVSDSLVEYGLPLIGVAAMPGLDALVHVCHNGPTILEKLSTGDSRELRVSSVTNLMQARVWFDTNVVAMGPEKAGKWLYKLQQNTTQPVAHGSATAGGMGVAMGNCDAYFHPCPKPFDMAAVGLAIFRAGGTVTDIDGNPWHAFSPSFFGSNGHIHDQVLKLLNS